MFCSTHCCREATATSTNDDDVVTVFHGGNGSLRISAPQSGRSRRGSTRFVGCCCLPIAAPASVQESDPEDGCHQKS